MSGILLPEQQVPPEVQARLQNLGRTVNVMQALFQGQQIGDVYQALAAMLAMVEAGKPPHMRNLEPVLIEFAKVVRQEYTNQIGQMIRAQSPMAETVTAG